MTMLITDGTTDYDGSGSPASAAGPILMTFSGVNNNQAKQRPVLTMYSRSDTADFVATYSTNSFERVKINLATGDDYYFKVTVPSGATVDLSVVDA